MRVIAIIMRIYYLLGISCGETQIAVIWKINKLDDCSRG